MANGRYRDVSSLLIGEHVYTGTGVPKRVLDIARKKTSISDDIVTIKHNGWYDVTVCNGNTKVLMFDSYSKKPSWMFANTIASSSKEYFTLPCKQKSEHAKIDFAYELGFIIGAYLRIGGLRNFPEIRFVYDAGSDIGNLITKYVATVYKCHPVTNTFGHRIQLAFFNKYLWNKLSGCGTFAERKIPTVLMQETIEFTSGVNCGIVKSGHTGLPRLSKSVYEMLYWSSLHSYTPMCYGQLPIDFDKVVYETCPGQVLMMDKSTETMYTLHIEEDVPFVANNMLISSS